MVLNATGEDGVAMPFLGGTLSFDGAKVVGKVFFAGKECEAVGPRYECKVTPEEVNGSAFHYLRFTWNGVMDERSVPAERFDFKADNYKDGTLATSPSAATTADLETPTDPTVTVPTVVKDDVTTHTIRLNLKNDAFVIPKNSTLSIGSGSDADLVFAHPDFNASWVQAKVIDATTIELTFTESLPYPPFSHTALDVGVEVNPRILASGVAPESMGFKVAALPNVVAKEESIATTLGISTSLSSGNPMTATAAGKLGGIFQLVNCPPGGEEVELSVMENPLQMKINASRYPVAAGAIYGNLIMLVAVLAFHFLVAACILQYRKLTGSGAIWYEAMGIARFPSFSVIPYLVFYEKMTESSYKLLFYGNAWEKPLAVLVLMTYCYGVPAAIYWLLKVPNFRCENYNYKRNAVLAFFWGELLWDSKEDNTYFRRWALIFKDFVYKYRFYLIADLLLIHMMAFIHSFRANSKSMCLIQIGATEVVVLIYLACTIRMLPFIARFDNLMTICAALCQAIAIVLIFIALEEEDTAGAKVKAAGGFLLASSVCVAAMALVDITTWIYERCRNVQDTAARQVAQQRQQDIEEERENQMLRAGNDNHVDSDTFYEQSTREKNLSFFKRARKGKPSKASPFMLGSSAEGSSGGLEDDILSNASSQEHQRAPTPLAYFSMVAQNRHLTGETTPMSASTPTLDKTYNAPAFSATVPAVPAVPALSQSTSQRRPTSNSMHAAAGLTAAGSTSVKVRRNRGATVSPPAGGGVAPMAPMTPLSTTMKARRTSLLGMSSSPSSRSAFGVSPKGRQPNPLGAAMASDSEASPPAAPLTKSSEDDDESKPGDVLASSTESRGNTNNTAGAFSERCELSLISSGRGAGSPRGEKMTRIVR